jgi:hypothetical protein
MLIEADPGVKRPVFGGRRLTRGLPHAAQLLPQRSRALSRDQDP